MTETITLLIGFILGYGIASFLLAKKKFIIRTNATGETTIERMDKPKQKMEFLPEIDRTEEEEIERPGPLQKFLGGFKKPASKEEEEEEI